MVTAGFNDAIGLNANPTASPEGIVSYAHGDSFEPWVLAPAGPVNPPWGHSNRCSLHRSLQGGVSVAMK